MVKKTILLDRDGIINQDSYSYIKSVNEFILLPGSLEALVRLTHAGYQIGIATNQSGISRGYYSEQTLADIHDALLTAVHKVGGEIHAIEYCKHLPDAGCACRKPRAGMLTTLAQRLGCSLKDVPFVGDKISDIQAALTAGATPMVVISPMTDTQALQHYPHVPVFESLNHCVDYLVH